MRAGPETHERWKSQPLASPGTGERVLFAATVQDGVLLVWSRSVRPDSPAERERLRSLLQV